MMTATTRAQGLFERCNVMAAVAGAFLITPVSLINFNDKMGSCWYQLTSTGDPVPYTSSQCVFLSFTL
jgi:hypothetical protein